MKNILLIFLLIILSVSCGKEKEMSVLPDIKDEDTSLRTDNLGKSGGNENKLVMYYFYGRGCSACNLIKKDIDELPGKYNGRLELKKYEVWYDNKNRKTLLKMAKERGVDKNQLGTPTIIIGDDLYVGNKMEKIEKIINNNL